MTTPPRDLTRRQFLTRVAGGTLLAVSLPELLAACTSAGQSTTSTASGSPGGPSTATLRVGWSSEPDTMNPLTSYSTEALEVQQLIYDKLMDYDANLKAVPALATSSDVSADGAEVTYHLRTGVTWHDGEPFTADDVVFTYQTIADQGASGYAQWLGSMKSVKASGDDVIVTFTEPQAFDPALAIPILPKHIWDGMSTADVQKFANDAPVGTGPYTFGEWKHGQTVSVNRNDAFWGTPPGPAAILWVLYQVEDVMAQSLRNGEVDILPEVAPTIFDGIADAEGLRPVSLPGFSFHHIGMNVSTESDSKGNPLLLQKELRQALSCATDRNQLVQIALAGHGQPGAGLIPPALTDFQLQLSADQELNANPDKANQLLDGLGYTMNADGVRETSDGTPLQFRLIAIESTTVDVRAAQLFRDSCAKVGVKMDITTMDENTLGSLVYETHRLGPVRVGLGLRGQRPRLPAGGAAHEPDRWQQRHLLREPGLRRPVRAAGLGAGPHEARRPGEPGPAAVLRRLRVHRDVVPGQAAGVSVGCVDRVRRHAGRHHLQLHPRQLHERDPGLSRGS